MRTHNTLKNITWTLIAYFITIMMTFINQAVFIKILGNEYLGLNSLFNNIVSILSITELGIGSAIIFNLYKPIADKDIETIKSLLKYYKKSYNIISIIILFLGLSIVPLLKYIINFNTIAPNINIYFIYFLFLLDIIFSYLFTYKRSILYANEKNYIINIVHTFSIVLLNLSQILLLYFTKIFYLYLIIKIIMRLMENVVLNIISNYKYSYLKDKNIKEIPKNIKQNINIKIKALFFHKIGTYVVNSTDNIIISKFLGIISVGLYSNYYLIINAVHTIFYQIIASTTASVGNVLVTETKEKQYEIFEKIRFLNFWVATFSSTAILIIIENFIEIWIGENYLLATSALIVLVINFYQNIMRASYNSFKNAAGIFYEDRFVPLLESLINIIASIILLKYFGLAGVFMGTITSSLILWCYSYPKYIYKKLFNRSYYDYFKETLSSLVLFSIIAYLSFLLSKLIVFSNVYQNIIWNIFIALLVPNVIMIISSYKTNNFKYYISIFKKIVIKEKSE